MITTSELTLAEHEAASAEKPWVLVRKHQYQTGFGSLPGRMFYNTVAGAIVAGSTVTIETLIKQGYRVEVVE